jgi:hypothetical protein
VAQPPPHLVTAETAATRRAGTKWLAQPERRHQKEQTPPEQRSAEPTDQEQRSGQTPAQARPTPKARGRRRPETMRMRECQGTAQRESAQAAGRPRHRGHHGKRETRPAQRPAWQRRCAPPRQQARATPGTHARGGQSGHPPVTRSQRPTAQPETDGAAPARCSPRAGGCTEAAP